MPTIETDYLVIGAGAMGMAFADTMVAESDARMVIVDRNHQPGGHWTRAYPFVRLHQPSAYYGVNSRELGSGSIDTGGWNQGLAELATGGEVCAYFERVLEHDLLPTGRVRHFPMSEYLGDGLIRDMAGAEYTVSARRVVDATYLQTVVPVMRPPAYEVAGGVECVAPNDLPLRAGGRDRFVVIGAGKTGVDVCLWLLRNGIGPDRLTWVMPRDAWLLDRANIQADGVKASFTARLAAIRAADSVGDLFTRLEAAGSLLRLDGDVTPSMYRCATVSRAELDQLRRIPGIVRRGRVTRLEPGRVTLTGGDVTVDGDVLHIDCSADGLERRPGVPVFGADRITLQSVRGCQQVFSAALIAHIENGFDESAKNDLCEPIPHPNSALDWLGMTLAEQRNEVSWIETPELMDWLAESRLNLTAGMFRPILQRERARERLLAMLAKALREANDALAALMGSAAGADAGVARGTAGARPGNHCG